MPYFLKQMVTLDAKLVLLVGEKKARAEGPYVIDSIDRGYVMLHIFGDRFYGKDFDKVDIPLNIFKQGLHPLAYIRCIVPEG